MEGTIVRRVRSSPRTAVAFSMLYVMDNDKHKAPELRQMSPFEGAPEEFDQTIFAVQKDRTIGTVEGLTLNLVKDQQSFSVFLTLPVCESLGGCGACTSKTGPVNFQEYR
ncbi:hypothetical protein PTKIN_Ptkin14bG0043500 [Pterospermum kingtungense]